MTDSELKILKHMTGLDRAPKRYRNYYEAAHGSEAHRVLDDLSRSGLVVARTSCLASGVVLFHATDAGLEAVDKATGAA
jgi:hypothetical protein